MTFISIIYHIFINYICIEREREKEKESQLSMILTVISIQYFSKCLNKNVCIESRSLKSVNEWYLCEKCVNLNTDRECVCCNEFGNLQKFYPVKKCALR